MDRDELGPVRESRLDLNVVDEGGDAVHDLVGPHHMGAGLHQVGDRSAVARALDDEVGDQRDGLGIVQLDAALEPASRDHGGHGDEQLVLFARRQIHFLSFSSSSSAPSESSSSPSSSSDSSSSSSSSTPKSAYS